MYRNNASLYSRLFLHLAFLELKKGYLPIMSCKKLSLKLNRALGLLDLLQFRKIGLVWAGFGAYLEVGNCLDFQRK